MMFCHGNKEKRFEDNREFFWSGGGSKVTAQSNRNGVWTFISDLLVSCVSVSSFLKKTQAHTPTELQKRD